MEAHTGDILDLVEQAVDVYPGPVHPAVQEAFWPWLAAHRAAERYEQALRKIVDEHDLDLGTEMSGALQSQVEYIRQKTEPVTVREVIKRPEGTLFVDELISLLQQLRGCHGNVPVFTGQSGTVKVITGAHFDQLREDEPVPQSIVID